MMKRYLVYLLMLLFGLLLLGCTGSRTVETTVPDVTTVSDSTTAPAIETTTGIMAPKSNEELIDELIQQIKSVLSE